MIRFAFSFYLQIIIKITIWSMMMKRKNLIDFLEDLLMLINHGSLIDHYDWYQQY